MPQWTAFDEDTTSALHSKLPGETINQLSARSALEHALEQGKTLVAILPSPGLGQAALAVMRWNRVAATTLPATIPAPHVAPPPPPPVDEVLPERRARATGFLGLTDEAVFDEEQEVQEKKSWWKRFWDE